MCHCPTPGMEGTMDTSPLSSKTMTIIITIIILIINIIILIITIIITRPWPAFGRPGLEWIIGW